MPTPSDKQVVLVTGCTSGGIGWHLCTALAAQGAVVYASARRLAAMEGLKERGCRLVQLDVTSKESIAKTVEHIIEEAGRIDGEGNRAPAEPAAPVLQGRRGRSRRRKGNHERQREGGGTGNREVSLDGVFDGAPLIRRPS